MATTTAPVFLHGKNTRVIFVNPTYTGATLIANTTSGSTQIVAVSSTYSVSIGQPISGSGIPSNTTITNIMGQTITLSAAATATASGVSLTVSSTGIGYDISPFFNDVSVAFQHMADETTTFLQNGFKTYIAGLKEGTITMSGFYDGTVSGVDSILATAVANSADETAIVFPAGGITDNELCFMAKVLETKYDLKSPISGIVTAEMDLQADGGVWRGRGKYLTVSSSGNTPAYTPFPAASAGTASTTNGGLLVLGIASTTGTGTWSLVFQHSQDGTTWVSGTPPNTGGNLVTDGAIGAQVTTLTGTIYQYTRLAYTLTGTGSATIYFGFARY